MVKALIFDFYGVVYSDFDWEIIDERIYSDSDKANKFTSLETRANKGLITNEEFLISVSKLAEDYKYPNKPAVKTTPSINYSILGLIESLKKKYKIALLSNGTHAHIDRIFETMGDTNKFFDIVATSSDTQFIKPDKKAFISVASKLRMHPNETIVIDDSGKHIEGAHNAGFITIKFDNMRQLRKDLEERGVY